MRRVLEAWPAGDLGLVKAVSAFYGGTTGGNTGGTATSGTNLYSAGLAGTSFSAPIVAGGVALLDSAAKARGLASTSLDARVVNRSDLATPHPGPCIVEEYDATTLVPPGWNARLDEYGNIVMSREMRSPAR